MNTDIFPNLIAAVVFVLVPLLLWGEAIWNGSRRFRILTTALLVWWLAIVAVVTVPEFLCDGSVLKGLGTCTGLFSAKIYERALIISPGIFIIPPIYVIAVIHRIVHGRAK